MTGMQPSAAPRRRRLGRGLDALLSTPSAVASDGPIDADDRDDGTARLVDIDPHRVLPNPEQPRTVFDPEDLEALVESVRVHGVLQPIVVERTADGAHRLIAGERRLRAAHSAGLSAIPAIVRPAAESARQALELALTENLVRADLSPLEEATAYSRLADTFGLSHEAIGLRVGRSRAAISNAVRLLTLPAGVLTALADNRLSAGHARALLGLPGDEARLSMARRIEADQLSVRDVERAVQDGSAGDRRPRNRPAPPGADETALTRGFEAAVGAPVSIQRKGRGGRVIIDFHSDDELDGLYQRLGGPPL